MSESTNESLPTTPFPADEYTRRLARLARKAAAARLDALFVLTDVNRLYLTGLPASSGILCVAPGATPTFHTDFRYLEAARGQLRFLDVGKLAAPGKLFGPRARKERWRRAGYEGLLPAARYHELCAAMPRVEEWVDAEPLIQDLRAVKSPREQALLRRAAAATDAVFAHTLADITPGMTEWEIRLVLRGWADRLAQGEAFDCIVCVGSNASRCHHHPGGRVLERGQELLIDLGMIVQDYRGDMTRTVFFGEPTRKLREIYAIVLEANRRAIRAVRAGKTCGAIDAVARGYIAKRGYRRYFDHGLGHGLGLDIHEGTRLAKDNKKILKSGMTVTVEPGIYIPRTGGVRIEDMVLVRPRGCEVLTRTPKNLLCL